MSVARLPERYRYIVIEGPIGAGKTALAERLGTRLDRAVIDVAGRPGGASIVDAAGLAGLETHGHADTIARCDGCFHLPAPAPHHCVHPLAECEHRDEGERGENEPLRPLREVNSGQPHQADQRRGNADEHKVKLRVDDEHFDAEQTDAQYQPTPPRHAGIIATPFAPQEFLWQQSRSSISLA